MLKAVKFGGKTAAAVAAPAATPSAATEASVVAAPAAPAPAPKRENWMTEAKAGSALGKLTSSTKQAKFEAKAAADAESAARNADLKSRMDAGGLINLFGGQKPSAEAPAAAAAAAATPTPPSAPAIGDGGASWRARLLKRAQERAGETGESVAAIVQQHHGGVRIA
jgi:hypothetical protein